MISKWIDRFIAAGFKEPDMIERYLFAAYFCHQFFGMPDFSVLDVGGMTRNPQGIQGLPSGQLFDDFVSIDVKESADIDRYVNGSGLHLPFRDNSFDAVISLDVFEHIAPGDRNRFIDELHRVSKDIVFLSFPFQSELNSRLDSSLYRSIKKMLGEEFVELKEHMDNGLPDLLAFEDLDKYDIKGSRTWIGDGGSIPHFLHFFFIRYLLTHVRHKEKLERLETDLLKSFYLNQLDQAPFYRKFLVFSQKSPATFSKQAGQIQQDFIGEMRTAVRNRTEEVDGQSLLSDYLYLFDRFLTREKVSVFVIIKGRSDIEQMRKVLDHLTTQVLDEEILEITVVYQKRNQVASLVDMYPQIQFINRKGRLPLHWFLSVSSGEYIYITSKDNLTYTATIKELINLLNRFSDNKMFIKFSQNRKESIDEVRISGMPVMNHFFRRELFSQVKWMGPMRWIRFNGRLKGIRINRRNRYFNLLNSRQHDH